MMAEGKPLVSTFEGPGWADNWARVRDQTGGICLIPDWSSLGPHGVGQRLDCIDGACKLTAALGVGAMRLRGAVSWDAWPKTRQSKMTTVEDILYQGNLGGKKYMMGVSPWFYTGKSALQGMSFPILTQQSPDLAQWNKHWYCSSEPLWYDRWQQILEVMPDFVQIITCMYAVPGRASYESNADFEKGMTLASQATSATHCRHKSFLDQRSMLLGTHMLLSEQFCLF